MVVAPSAPALVGILNLTDDSFAGDGLGADVDAALRRAEEMLLQGAAWLDVGAESSRPGAKAVDEATERRRVEAVCAALVGRFSAQVAVDTRRASTAEAALAAGARMVNDTSGWPTPAMAAVVRKAGAAWVLMHAPHELGAMGPSQAATTMPRGAVAGVAKIADDLRRMREDALSAGVAPWQLIADPGIGFGKDVPQNLALLLPQPALRSLGMPLYLGPSRKSVLGAVTGRSVEDRLPATAVAVAAAVGAGAAYLRVHDVAAAADAVAMAIALMAVMAEGELRPAAGDGRVPGIQADQLQIGAAGGGG